MKEEDLDALPWINGPESGGIRGFGFRDEDDPQRYQVMYSSLHEKLWCEASGLLMMKLWDEAEENVAELSKYLGQRDTRGSIVTYFRLQLLNAPKRLVRLLSRMKAT